MFIAAAVAVPRLRVDVLVLPTVSAPALALSITTPVGTYILSCVVLPIRMMFDSPTVPSTPEPIQILFDSELVYADAALYPRAVLVVPVVRARSELNPTDVFS